MAIAREKSKADLLDVSAYVVLGMIWLGARSGYEIKRTVDASIRFFWTISQAQIYPSLERLERCGLVRGRADPTGKRPRRLYTITRTGEAALKRWLTSGEEISFELRDVGLLKLFFADALDSGDARSLLAKVKSRSEERVKALHAIEPLALQEERRGNIHPLLTLRAGLAFHRAMVDVCADFGRTRSARRPKAKRVSSSESRPL